MDEKMEKVIEEMEAIIEWPKDLHSQSKWSETIWIFWTFADRDFKTYRRYRAFIFRWLTSMVRKVTKRDQKDKQEVMKKWSFVCLGTCYCAFTLKAGGYTIAVLGNGLDICYPSEHRILMENIAKQGLLISEYEPGIKPQYGEKFAL